MYQKQNGLTVEGYFFAKIYITEIKGVISFRGGQNEKTRGGKYEDKSGDVIENKWWKNVRIPASRDVDENKRAKIALWRW